MSVSRPRLIPSSVAASLLLVALGGTPAPGATFASAPAPGTWSGALKSRSGNVIRGAKVTFRVTSSRVTGFAVRGAPVNCNYNPLNPTGWRIELRTIQVPSAAIRGRAFTRVYEPKRNGQTIGKITLKGEFTARTKAAGTLKYTSAGCLGDYRFSVSKT